MSQTSTLCDYSNPALQKSFVQEPLPILAFALRIPLQNGHVQLFTIGSRVYDAILSAALAAIRANNANLANNEIARKEYNGSRRRIPPSRSFPPGRWGMVCVGRLAAFHIIVFQLRRSSFAVERSAARFPSFRGLHWLKQAEVGAIDWDRLESNIYRLEC
jgi:hypothetical protein